MRLVTLLILSVMVGLSGCAATDAVDPRSAQIDLNRAWQADQHTVWEINWPEAPVGGPLVVETWRAGGRYRFEILEAEVAALFGQVLVFDGRQGWHYNRFEPGPPAESDPPALAPVTELLAKINAVSAARPEQATARPARLDHGPAQEFRLSYSPEPGGAEKYLTWWRDVGTGLPVRIHLVDGQQEITLRARSFEPLPRPQPELFKPFHRVQE